MSINHSFADMIILVSNSVCQMPVKKIHLVLLLLLMLFPAMRLSGQPEKIVLTKSVLAGSATFSGDNQQQKTKTVLKESIRAVVTDTSGHALPGVPIRFEVLSVPHNSNGFSITPVQAWTDSMGIAATRVTLGNEPGEYTMIARVSDNPFSEILVYRFTALKKNWVFMLLIGLLGGLGLFLLGMNMMSEGMQKSAGAGLRTILGNLTRNRYLALIVGTVVTMIIQSSSATTVMMVGFVNSGLWLSARLWV